MKRAADDFEQLRVEHSLCGQARAPPYAARSRHDGSVLESTDKSGADTAISLDMCTGRLSHTLSCVAIHHYACYHLDLQFFL